jgi:hypothetical protein
MQDPKQREHTIASLTKQLQSAIGREEFKRYFGTVSRGDSSALVASFNDPGLLDIDVDIADSDAVISYYNDTYDNRSEMMIPDANTPEKTASDLFSIIETYLRKGAKRTDAYVGRKMVSSTLQVGDMDKTTKITGQGFIGKRRMEDIVYPPPLAEG